MNEPRDKNRRWSSDGFTLIELMITFLLASVVMASVFVMYTQVTKSFHRQGELIKSQAQLRFALDNLKNDIRRAGFQATIHSQKDTSRVCWTPPGVDLLALTIERGNGFVHLPTVNVDVAPSSITLFGDYFSPNAQGFYAFQVDSGGNVYMDPLDATLSAMSEAEFDSIFRPNVRWLRVVTKDEKEWYSKIIATDYPNRRLTLSSSPPGSGYCLAGFGQGSVNPVGWIRYELREDTRTAALLADGAELRDLGKTDLVRVEVDSDGVPVENTALVIAEYVVDLQFYDFGLDLTSLGQTTSITHFPLVEDVATSGGTGLLGSDVSSSRTNDLRYLTPKVSVRTPHEDQDFFFTPRESDYGPLLSFELDQVMDGSARVESLASRVDVRNFALRRVK